MIAANTSELSLVAVHVGYCAGRLQMRIFFRSFHWVLIAIIFNLGGAQAQTSADSFSWPDGNQAALSLSFDDSRTSQVDGGTALLNRLGVKVTFYVVPSRVEERLPGWKAAVASGHEIANHFLASKMPDKAAELSKKIHDWLEESGTIMHTENAAYRP